VNSCHISSYFTAPQMKSIEKNSYILYNNKIKDISSKAAISNLPLKQYKNDYKFQSLFFIEL